MKHQSDPRILNRRTLEGDHRRLAGLLAPGMRVLDVGCGTGSITAGIAKAVGPTGFVVGLDRDAELLAQAAPSDHLQFVHSGILDYHSPELFDIATASRALQWIAPPLPALERMRDLLKPGGLLVVLDFNHAAHSWSPDSRPAFAAFYQAFLDFREANGWSNQIAAELPGLFHSLGLVGIESRDESESDLSRIAEMWTQMTENISPTLVRDGFLTEPERLAAREANQGWLAHEGRAARLELRSIVGRVR
jgi:SAM-dependent methyltransferase